MRHILMLYLPLAALAGAALVLALLLLPSAPPLVAAQGNPLSDQGILPLDRSPMEATLTETGPAHRWQLQNVPNGILVVQSYRGQDVNARLLAADGATVLKENDDFLNQISFRITHRVTGGPANFILEVEPGASFAAGPPPRPYGLIAEVVDVVGTVEHNRSASPPITLEASATLPPRLPPAPHYYRVVVPPESAGRDMAVRVDNPNDDGRRIELLTADGEFIAQALHGRGEEEIRRVLDPGEYLLAVSGGNGSASGNLGHAELPDYFVTSRDLMTYVAFRTFDQRRWVGGGTMVEVEVQSNLVATRTIDLLVTGVPGTATTETRMITIPQGEYSASLTFTAPRHEGPPPAPFPIGTVNLALELGGAGDEAMVDPSGARAVITVIPNRAIVPLDRTEVTRELTATPPGNLNTWYLTNVPDDTLLVVQSVGDVHVEGLLQTAVGGMDLNRNDGYVNQNAFRIMRPVTDGRADFILKVSGVNNATGDYRLFAEALDVVGTVEYNRPAGAAMNIAASTMDQPLPTTHYYRVVVPPEAAGRAVTLRTVSDNGGTLLELLDADGDSIADTFSAAKVLEITRVLEPGEYFLAVNGEIDSQPGDNLNQDALRDYVVTLRGPEVVAGFATDDLSRTVPENEEFALTVTLAPDRGMTFNGVLLDVAYSGGGGYTGPATVTIPQGARSAELRLRVPGNRVVGTMPPPLTVTLSDSRGRYVLQPGALTARVAFTENDPVAVVGFVGDLTPTLLEGETVTLRAQLQDGVVATRAIDVRVDLSGGVTATRLLTIAEGAGSGSIQIGLPDNDVAVVATLVDGLPGGAPGRNEQYDVAPGAARTTITIVDDDAVPLLGFESNSYVFTEGETVTVPVTLRGNVDPAAPITVRVQGAPGGDQTVTLSAASRSADVTFMAPDDERAAPPGNVVLTIVDNFQPNVAIVLPGLGMTTVRFRDDGDPVARVAFGPRTRARSADEGAMLRAFVRLQDGVTATRAIELRLSGFGNGPRTLTIPQGQSSNSLGFTVPSIDPGAVLDTLNLTLEVAGNGDEALVDPSGARARVVITHDSDVTDTLLPGLDKYFWNLRNVPDGALLVVQSFNHVDVRARLFRGGTVLKENDNHLNQIAFRITHRVTGGPANFILEVSRADPGVTGEYGLSAELVDVVGTVEYNRPAGTPETIDAALGGTPAPHYYRVVVPEEARGQEVTLRAASAMGAMRLELLSADGTFISDVNSSFDLLETELEITRTLDPGEYLLAVSGWATPIGGNRSPQAVTDYVVTLRGPVLAGFAADDLSRTVPENEPFALTVGLAPGLGMAINDVTLDVAYSGGGGYTGPATVTIPQGANSAELQLQVPHNTVVGTAPPPLMVTLSNPSMGSQLLPSFVTATVTLTDSDPPVEVGFGASSYVFTEGEQVTVPVELMPGRTLATPLTVMVTGVPGRQPAQPLTLTIAAGARSADVTFTAPDDERHAPPAAVTLAIVDNLPPEQARLVPNLGMATVRLRDNDPLASVGFTGAANRSGEEGSMITLRAELMAGGPATRAIDVRVALSGGAGGTGGTMGEQTLTIADGANFGEIQIQLPDDQNQGQMPMDVVATIIDAPSDLYEVIDINRRVTIAVTDDDVVMVGFSRATYTFTEGEQFMVPVELKGGIRPAGAITVMVSAPDQGTRSVSFSSSGNVSNNVTFTAPDDDDARAAPDDLTLTIVNPQGFQVAPGFGMATVSFRDDGDTLAEVGFSSRPPTSVTERETVTLNVELMAGGPATQAVTVTVTDDDGFTQDVTILNGQSSASFDYTAPDDKVAHGAPPPRTLRLFNPMKGIVASGSGSATITFRDDNDPIATLRFVGDLAPEGLEGTMVTLRAELLNSVPATQAIRATVRLSAGTLRTRTLAIDPGQSTSREFNVDLPTDNTQGQAPDPVVATLVVEGPGRFDYNVVSGAGSSVTITVIDDDVLSVGFGASSYTFTEGSGMVTVPVELKGSVNPAGNLMVTVEGVPGQPNGRQTLTLSATSRSADITFMAPDDDKAASPSPVVLTLSAPSGVQVAPNLDMATVRFTDEGDALAVVGFMNPPATLDEGEMVTLNLALTAGGPATRAVTVTVTDGQGFTQDVTIQNGQSTAGFGYTAPNDQNARVAPAPVVLTLRLINPMEGIVASGSGSAAITFRDDDPLAVVGFVGSATRSGAEGSMITLRAQLMGGENATRAIDVRVDLSGDLSGERRLTIADGANFGEIQIQLPSDDVQGRMPADVTATLVDSPLGSTGGNDRYDVAVGAARMVAIAVTDDDMVSVGFGAASYVVTEGAQVTVPVELKSSANPDGNLMVTVEGVPGRPNGMQTLTFSAANRSDDITFTVPGDSSARVTPANVVLRIIAAPQGFELAQGLGMATVRFRDDDPLASVGFAAGSDRMVAEGETVTLTVELQGGVTATRAIDLMVHGVPVVGTPTTATRAITIQTGTASALLAFTAPHDDAASVAPAPLTLTLAMPANAALTAGRQTAMIQILDDDAATPPPPGGNGGGPPSGGNGGGPGNGGGGGGMLMLTIRPAGSAEVREGDSVVYIITRTDAADAISVRIGVTGRSPGADPSDDLSTVGGTVGIPAGITGIQHTISARRDGRNERAERFSVTFTPVNERGVALGPPQRRDLIVAGDVPFAGAGNIDFTGTSGGELPETGGLALGWGALVALLALALLAAATGVALLTRRVRRSR